MPNRLRRWLAELDVQEMNVNLGVVSFKIGKRKPGEAEPKPIDPPTPPAPKPPAQDQEPDLDRDLPTDPMLASEPELTPKELEQPVSLAGTTFEQQLRDKKEVADRLRHSQHATVALKAFTFFIDGLPKGTKYERDRETWKRIRGECRELILNTLDHHHQRATYGAVAGIVGVLARSVMSGQSKTPRNSWVVSVKTKMPTGYSDTERHTAIEERRIVLETPNQLREWLRNPT